MAPVRHHLSEPLLAAYAAGTLAPAFELVIAAHLSLCDECRAAAGAWDALGGALVEAADAAPLREGALERALAGVAGAAPEPRPAPVPGDPVLPEPVRRVVGGGIDAVRWRSVGGGVRQAVLPLPGPASVRLIEIPGGVAVPDHGHRGTEVTLVLAGAYRDETDRFGRGDVEVADAAMVHRPVAETGASCICLAAADGKLRFKGLLPRLAQPFIGI